MCYGTKKSWNQKITKQRNNGSKELWRLLLIIAIKVFLFILEDKTKYIRNVFQKQNDKNKNRLFNGWTPRSHLLPRYDIY